MSTLVIDTIQGKTTAGSINVRGEGSNNTNLQQGLAKHWCSFNGQGTVAITDSFNNASLTDNGTGDYNTAITNDFANVNYASSTCGGYSSDGNYCASTDVNRLANGNDSPPSASTRRMTASYTHSGAAVDNKYMQIINVGDLA